MNAKKDFRGGFRCSREQIYYCVVEHWWRISKNVIFLPIQTTHVSSRVTLGRNTTQSRRRILRRMSSAWMSLSLPPLPTVSRCVARSWPTASRCVARSCLNLFVLPKIICNSRRLRSSTQCGLLGKNKNIGALIESSERTVVPEPELISCQVII